MGRRDAIAAAILTMAGCGGATIVPSQQAKPTTPTPTSASTSVVASSPAPMLPPVALAFELRVDASAPAFVGVWMVARDAGFEVKLAHVPAAAVCVVGASEVESTASELDDGPTSAPGTGLLQCGSMHWALRAIEDGVVVGGSPYYFGRRPFFVAGMLAREVPPCAAGTVGPKIAVTTRLGLYGTSDALTADLFIEALGVSIPVADGLGQVIASPRPAAEKLYVFGSWGESGMAMVVSREGQMLRVTEESSGMGTHVPEHTVARYWLPCGATLDPKGGFARSAGWFPTGAECFPCGSDGRVCDENCKATYSDAAEVLSKAGAQCAATCEKKVAACVQVCRAKQLKKKP